VEATLCVAQSAKKKYSGNPAVPDVARNTLRYISTCVLFSLQNLEKLHVKSIFTENKRGCICFLSPHPLNLPVTEILLIGLLIPWKKNAVLVIQCINQSIIKVF
jgi:hypothetical protein